LPLGAGGDILALERFQDKWIPVIRPETRQSKDLESGFDCHQKRKSSRGQITSQKRVCLKISVEDLGAWGFFGFFHGF
jgi:hypothetical protein